MPPTQEYAKPSGAPKTMTAASTSTVMGKPHEAEDGVDGDDVEQRERIVAPGAGALGEVLGGELLAEGREAPRDRQDGRRPRTAR